MRYLLLVIMLLYCGVSHSQQTPPTYPFPKPMPQTGTTPSQLTRISQAIAPTAYNNDSPAVWAPQVGGGWYSVLNANERLSKTNWNVEGAVLYDASDQTFYATGPDRKATRPLFKMDGTWFGGLGATNTFYTSDGTITTDRTVTLSDGKIIAFEGSTSPGKFYIGRTNAFGEIFLQATTIDLSAYAITLGATGGGNTIRVRPLGYTSSKAGDVLTALEDGTGNVGYAAQTSIYTADGTILTNRTINISSNLIRFTGSNINGAQFTVDGVDQLSLLGDNTISYGSFSYDFGSPLKNTMWSPGITGGSAGYVLTVIDPLERTVDFRPASGAATTLYVSNGTLTGNRDVNLAGNNLSFTNGASTAIFNVGNSNDAPAEVNLRATRTKVYGGLSLELGANNFLTITNAGNGSSTFNSKGAIQIASTLSSTVFGQGGLNLISPTAVAVHGTNGVNVKSDSTINVDSKGAYTVTSDSITAYSTNNLNLFSLNGNALLSAKSVDVSANFDRIGLSAATNINIVASLGKISNSAPVINTVAGSLLTESATTIDTRASDSANLLAANTLTASANAVNIVGTNSLLLLTPNNKPTTINTGTLDVNAGTETFTAGTLVLKGTNITKMITPGVFTGSSRVGQMLKLYSTTGDVEFGDAGNGLTVGDAIITNTTVYRVFSPTPPYPTSAAYPDHFMVNVRPNTQSAGGESLQIGSGPIKAIKLSTGSALPVGDIMSGINYTLSFNALLDSWILENPSSGIVTDSTLYSSVSGPTVTIGVATNALPLNRLSQLPPNTILANPNGTADNAMPVGLTGGLLMIGTNLTTSIPTLYNSDGSISATPRTVTIPSGRRLNFDGTGVANGTTFNVTGIGIVHTDGATNDHFAYNELNLAVANTGALNLRPHNIATASVGDSLVLTNTTGKVAALPIQHLYRSDGTLTSARTVNAPYDLTYNMAATAKFSVINGGLTQSLAKTNVIYSSEETTISGVQRLKVHTPLVNSLGAAAMAGKVLTIDSSGNSEYQTPAAGGSGTVVYTAANYTVAAGVSLVYADATAGNITITLPAGSTQQEVAIIKVDNAVNMVTIVNAGADIFYPGGTMPIRLFLKGESVRTRGLNSGSNAILGSQSFDLGTIADMRNYTMLFRSEFADSTAGSFWGQNSLATTANVVEPNHSFVSLIATGAATNGMGFISLRGGSIVLNTANPIVESLAFQIPILPTATEYFVFEFGFGDYVTAVGADFNDANCVYFRYAQNENGGKFRARVCANGVGNSQYTDDTVITPAASTWYLVTVFCSSARAYILINDTIIGPITTGLPTSGAMTVVGKVQKGIGTTARNVYLDYYKSARTAVR